MKVVIFEERTPPELERTVNKFLSNRSSHKVLDIKYTAIAFPTSYYSAMIILE